MFRSNSVSSSSLEGIGPIDNFSAFHGLAGLNMYLDTTTQSLSPPVSSATLSPPNTPLTSDPTAMSSTQFPLLSDNNNANKLNMEAASTLLLQRQYQYHLLLQQQQQQLALAQHQLALAASAAAANHHQKDEIAHSLKMFALLTACNADNGTGSIQDAMQEFAANGFASDESNPYPYSNPSSVSMPAPSPLPAQQFTISAGNSMAAAAAPVQPSLAAVHWMSLNNYREQLNNMWRNMSMSYIPNVTNNAGQTMTTTSQKCAAGLPLPPDQNVVHNNFANNKVNKRYVNAKAKDSVSRHCVFCENNNEPEALVNSHSVRDTFGRVLCPKLRTYVCPICGASGDSAHTIKYCPKKPIVTMEDAIKAESFRLAKSNYYKQQMKV
ncbi:protein nanos [Drosophila albomicans]|uniref:Protein nanos n=1 Tax=Drosophila albomicans TaxID=7291 RepID=A0A6P8X9I4_DROAB|nr:protein nanos [Drosophila albomicans]